MAERLNLPRLTTLAGLILFLIGVTLLTAGGRLVASPIPATQSYEIGDLKITAWSTQKQQWLSGVNVVVTIVNGADSQHLAGATDTSGVVSWTQVLVGKATITGHKYGYADASAAVQTQPNRSTIVRLDFSGGGAGTPFDFNMGISGNTNVQQGQSVSLGVNVYLVSGSGTATLSVKGCDNGLSCSFNVTAGIPTFSSNLNISASALAATGNRSVAVVAESGGIIKQSPFDVNVEPAPQQSSFSLSQFYGAISMQQGPHGENAISDLGYRVEATRTLGTAQLLAIKEYYALSMTRPYTRGDFGFGAN